MSERTWAEAPAAGATAGTEAPQTLAGRIAAALGGGRSQAEAPTPDPTPAPPAPVSAEAAPQQDADTQQSPSAAAAATAVAAAPATAAQGSGRRTILDLFRGRRGRESTPPQGEVISVITPDPQPATVETGAAPLQIESSSLPLAEPAAEPEAPQATPAPAPAAIAKPFLQTGTFSTRTNAETQVRALDGAGVPALIRTLQSSSGKTLYRVIAGPAASAAQQGEFSRIARSIGIKDAFPTAN